MHTDLGEKRGINLASLRKNLDMKGWSVCPSLLELSKGVDQEVLARIYNAMDVFLLPSKGEGFGIPYIEAQACGVPVIMTKCTSHQELFGGGWFIKEMIPEWTPQNSWQFNCHTEEVVECLEKAYQEWKDGSIKKRQKAAVRKVKRDYDEDKVYKTLWPPVLADIEKRINEPKNMEGVQDWRPIFIPTTCLPRKVIDIGCGLTMPYRSLLEPLGEYVPVDIRGGEGIVQADAHALPFEDKEFGFAWLSEVLEHVEDPEKVMAEAKRVAEHGVCIFCTPETPSFWMDHDHKVVELEHALIGGGHGLIVW